ncbi:MAG TPA: type II toxin-antitoxin system VapB family antitoxin [Dehalococcoidia bacterium]|nr:type II toxin-antitoxin system VapB family antitoxin [Dehalococcoidia bacterium]
MRTTVVIDEALLKKAREALGTETIRETVERALEEAVRVHRRQELLALLGNFELSLTPEELERWRSENEHFTGQP